MKPEQVVARLSEPLQPIENLVEPKHAKFLQDLVTSQRRVPLVDLQIIINAVNRCRPGATLEVGLASGTTAVAIMTAKPAGSTAIHTALDPHQTSNFHGQAIERINELGLSKSFRLQEVSSHIALPQLMDEGAKFDFIYIDGNHKFDFTLIEWFYSDKLLPVGGVIAFDDCQWTMVQTVLNFVEANRPYKIIKHNERTWLAVKMDVDRSRWFDFTPFVVPWGRFYSEMIERARRLKAV